MEGTYNPGVGLGDAMLLAQNSNGGFGGGAAWMWIIVLFFLMGGGAWGNNRGNVATQSDVYAANDAQNTWGSLRDISRQINQIGDGISSATYALNNTVQNGFTGVMRDNFGIQTNMMGGFANLAQAVNENRFAAQQCCCETNRNIDSVNYNAAINTNNINSVAVANTQRILDRLCAMEANAKDAEIAALRQKLADANLAYSQQAQTTYLIDQLKTTA